IHGMVGDDVLFGEGEDDNIYGGTGNDRIYGGTGIDGILGDDGVMLTSRNGMIEPLNRLFTPNPQYTLIPPRPFTPPPPAAPSTPGGPFNMAQLAMPIPAPMGLDTPLTGGNDVIYAGLGDDFVHGESGDDAISGAEAEIPFYNELPVVDTNPLHYNAAT